MRIQWLTTKLSQQPPLLSMTKIYFLFSLLVLILVCIIFECKLSHFSPSMGHYNSNSTTIHQAVSADNNTASQLSEIIAKWNGKPYPGVKHYIEYSNRVYQLNSSTIRRDFEPHLIDIKSYGYPITIPRCSKKQNLFFAVVSAPGNFEKRETIRQTWFRHLNCSHIIAFILASTEDASIQRRIEEESKEHDDIIQMNFIDNYHNLTLKAVGLLNWLNENCPRISYVLKCDDDIYVNIPNFSVFLGNVSSKESSIYGLLLENGPERNIGKWSLSIREWPWSSFPSYFFGPSTLITGQAVRPLLDAAKVSPYFWIDDIYLSGILAEKAGVNLHKCSDYTEFFIVNGNAYNDSCLIQKSISWLTNSYTGMNVSHHTIEDFHFHNKSRC